MAWSFHVQKVAADWMVMPFSRSSSMLSIVAPTPSLPRTCHGHGAGTMAWRCRQGLSCSFTGEGRWQSRARVRCVPRGSTGFGQCRRGPAPSAWFCRCVAGTQVLSVQCIVGERWVWAVSRADTQRGAPTQEEVPVDVCADANVARACDPLHRRGADTHESAMQRERPLRSSAAAAATSSASRQAARDAPRQWQWTARGLRDGGTAAAALRAELRCARAPACTGGKLRSLPPLFGCSSATCRSAAARGTVSPAQSGSGCAAPARATAETHGAASCGCDRASAGP
jgi:hypothetical protein